jgi:DNA mismatch repair protein MutL
MTTTETSKIDIQKIKLLPEHLIDQIKAGEVVERPSSLIKELLENSIDAKASKIEIQILENGLELISVEDNGKGISFQDLPYAFCRHATSKIERYEDLYKLNSYGFRGEALASIASSSKLICQSIPLESENGGRIEIDGGRQISLNHIAGNKNGTSIYIRELFYNTPARLKFIKSKQSEKNSLKRIINSFLIANPLVNFSVKWDDKDKIIFKSLSPENIAKRISKVFFNNKKNHLPLHSFNIEFEGSKISGYLSEESGRGNTGKSHYLFANNRLFNDKSLHQAILRNAKDLWGEGNIGHYAIFITTPPSEIDVNVHPNKIQVKFFKSSMIYSLLSSIISRSITEQIDAGVIKPSFTNHPENGQQRTYTDYNNQSMTQQPQAFDLNVGTSFIEKSTVNLTKGYLFSERFSIIDLSGKNWIIDNYKIYQLFWNNLQLDETKITPLIISEPFYISQSIEEHLKKLDSKGLEFDRINNELILLKTIPELINGFSLSNFITPYLNFILSDKSDSSIDYLTLNNQLCFSSLNEIFKIVNHYEIEFLEERNILCPFNESIITKFFSH